MGASLIGNIEHVPLDCELPHESGAPPSESERSNDRRNDHPRVSVSLLSLGQTIDLPAHGLGQPHFSRIRSTPS